VFIVGEAAMQSALTSGEWYVDNNQITEQLGLAQKVNESSSHNGSSTSTHTNMQHADATTAGASASSSNGRNPKLVPIKSFQNELLNLSVGHLCIAFAFFSWPLFLPI